MRRRHLAGIVAALALTGCGSGAGDSAAAFCEDARDRADVFDAPGDRLAGPGIVGAFRDLAGEAPDEIRDDLEAMGEAGSEEELDAAIAEVRRYVAEECDVSLG
jgi:hypothetical protein